MRSAPTGGILLALVRPTTVGAAYVCALAARAGMHDVSGDDLGDRAKEITAFVESRYAAEISNVSTALVAAAVVVGALLGFVAGLVVRSRDRMARREERSPWSFLLHVLLVVVALHAWCEAYAMAVTPQLYAAAFYAQGGALRTVQIVVTDILGRSGVIVLGLLALVAYLAGPLSQWRRWPGRFRRAFLPRPPENRPRTRPRRAVGTTATLLVLIAAGALVAGGAFDRRGARGPVGAHVDLDLDVDLGLAPRVAHAAAALPPRDDARPNILILAADSLRDDRLEPRTAPRLSMLAARGTRFDRAYVSLPRTFPSWVTLLTGRHPHHHGVRSMFPRWEERAKDFDALPERLARAGYETTVVSDYAGDIFGRVDLGWKETDAPTFDFKQLVRQRALERETPLLPFLHSHRGRRAFPVLRELADAADPDMLADDALEVLDRAKGPFFTTVFFSTAHFPYAAPAPYYERFTSRGYRGRFKYHKPAGLGRESTADADDVAQVRGLYDGAVASIDAACGRILDGLARRGLDDRTIVIVLADHGETLYDHGHGQGHGDHLFGDEGTHIPFVVFDPRRERNKVAPHREATIVRDVDLAPTVYELTGVAAPSDLDGRSLVGAIDGASIAPALAYAETGLWFTEDIPGLAPELRLPYPDISRMTEIDTDHGDELVLQAEVRPLTIVAKHRMVRDARWKLVYVPTRDGVKYMLFDTEADPGETEDVVAAHPAELARLRDALLAWASKDPDMAIKNGFLVPRDAATSKMGPAKGASGAAVRMNGGH